jgi:hypothetical protein
MRLFELFSSGTLKSAITWKREGGKMTKMDTTQKHLDVQTKKVIVSDDKEKSDGK